MFTVQLRANVTPYMRKPLVNIKKRLTAVGKLGFGSLKIKGLRLTASEYRVE